jgi:hypothetical protein
MMLELIVAGLALAGFFIVLDRKDKRHAQQVDRLLLWRHDPHTASLPAPTDVPLYLPPEDDEAWNDMHRKAD